MVHPPLNFKPSTILIVDDKPDNLRVLAKMLNEQGYKVKKAIDGESSLMAAMSNPPDLILLDIKMPGMDGYEVCRELKSNVKTKDIPVIFISALNDVLDKVKAFNMGGVDYITKPFQEEEVIARINAQITIQSQKKLLSNKQKKLIKEIRHRKETEAILYQSRALISSILNSSLDGIAGLEAIRNPKTGEISDFRCLFVNPVMASLLNREPEDLQGKFIVRKLINKLKLNLFDSFVEVVETGKSLEQDFYHEFSTSRHWYHFIAVKLGDGFAITIRDITERKKMELKLQRLAHLDGLTKIANRRYFNIFLQQEWYNCQNTKSPISLILCDVDYFKSYNDYYGHQPGDDCLIKVAKVLSESVNRPGDLVARYGGEEFVIVLPNTSSEGAIALGQSIGNRMANVTILHEASIIGPYVTLSLGIATKIPQPGYQPSDLIQRADLALYEAKKQGRNRYVVST